MRFAPLCQPSARAMLRCLGAVRGCRYRKVRAMKPQRQLIEHCPEEGRYGDCQRTCVAAILDMNAADVPHFCEPPHAPKGEPGWWEDRQNAWLAQFGLATMTVAYSGDSATFDNVMEWTSRQSPTVPMIVCGKGGKGVNHVVVVLNGEIVCDPSGSGIVGPTLENTWEVQVLAALAAVTGTARTPQAVECEASQSGGEAVTPNLSIKGITSYER